MNSLPNNGSNFDFATGLNFDGNVPNYIPPGNSKSGYATSHQNNLSNNVPIIITYHEINKEPTFMERLFNFNLNRFFITRLLIILILVLSVYYLLANTGADSGTDNTTL